MGMAGPVSCQPTSVWIGLYIRIGILESPVFANIKARGKIVRAPIKVVLKQTGARLH